MAKKHDQAVQHSSEDPNWRTPRALFDALDKHFNFLFDAASSGTDCLTMQRGLGPGSQWGENALTVDWLQVTRLMIQHYDQNFIGGRQAIFINPPYSRRKLRETKDPSYDIAAWARKCYGEAKAGCTIVGLFPYSPQTEWYRRWVMGHADMHQTKPGEWVGADPGWHPQDGWKRWDWAGFAADAVWKLRRRVSYVNALTGEAGDNAGGNSCVIVWRPNPGIVGPWQPCERYWDWQD